MFSINDSPAGGASRRSWLKKLGGVLGGGFLLGNSKAVARPQPAASPQGEYTFLGEIMMVAHNLTISGWLPCDGQILQINQNSALYALLGNQFGGDGRTTFALPDMRGRVMAYRGSAAVGGKAGTETHVLQASEMPAHYHGLAVSTALGTTSLAGTTGPAVHNFLADGGAGVPQYGNINTVNTALANVSEVAGGNQGHENRQPYISIRFLIAVQGIFPSRS
ncbi:phage tail protein [Hymenobacter lucidus]|uniref:Tail fiber protein n=1 Tax=Hymenobacter lucidus TaxID=2880930 RepID=A0ABS8AX44_9BACT|nr:tail fiber protein [Hymenobacter lucidus]MCB2410357.1 tail fiber protein [Hymenobacter lucidus]